MEIWKKTKELLAGLADVTEAGSKLARYKIEVANLDRKLGLALRRIGERVYQLNGEDDVDLYADPGVKAAMEEVRKMRRRMEAIHREVGRTRGKASSDLSRAATAVKKEAERAGSAVKREADRAASLVKEETSRARAAFGKGTPVKKKKSPPKKSDKPVAPVARKDTPEPAVKKAPPKKAPVKKAAAKKAPAARTSAKKPAKKAPAKKTPVKKAGGKKPAAAK